MSASISVDVQLKVAVSPTTANGETPVQVSFVSTPELRLQILPSGRLNVSVSDTKIANMKS